MQKIINTNLVCLDENLGKTAPEVIKALSNKIANANRTTETNSLFQAALDRENKTPTGLPGGIAIPHCRSSAITEATIAMARLPQGVDFGATDGPADLIFFIAAPEGANEEHLILLSTLARSLIKQEFLTELRAAKTTQNIVNLITNALKPTKTTETKPTQTSPTTTSLVAVTACPTGIAHTYMAADSLTAAAKKMGIKISIETQGSATVNPLDPNTIAAADAVIFATDVGVRNKERFTGKPTISVPVKRGIDEPTKLIEDALAAAKNSHTTPTNQTKPNQTQPTKNQQQTNNTNFAANLKRWLLTGVSYMIPFVAAGGLLIALSFLLAGYDITNYATDIITNNSLTNLPDGGLKIYIGAVLFSIGQIGLGFLVPALAGFTAFAIADRPGIAPGFIGGTIAVTVGAGFLGGLIAGLLAGGTAYLIGRYNAPRWLQGLMPVVIIPLLASIITGGLMFLVLGQPIASLMSGLTNWLNSLTGTSAILLGIILGLMMAFDLGGPLNKVAYSFAVAGLGAGSYLNQAPWQIMAAVMAAGMVPPLAMALATTIDRSLFSPAERENGKSAWLLGAAFITEGAIPFAAADPLKVIPSGMLGAAVTGAIIMGTDVTSQAPHGGIFVLFAVGKPIIFLLAIAAGTTISALSVVALKRLTIKKVITEKETLPA